MRGWKDANSVLKSAMNLEKMIGAPAEEVVRVPANADEETLRSVYSKLGMPDTPDGYEFNQDGPMADENLQGPMKELYHKAGLTKAQAAILEQGAGALSEHLGNQDAEAYQATIAAQDKELQKEFGNAYNKQISIAQQAAEQLGFNGDILNAIESAVGYKETIKFMAGLGSYLGESRFVDGNGGGEGGNFGMSSSPEQAKNAWATFQSNPEKVKALNDKMHPNHKAVLEEKNRLFSLMYPDT